MPCRTPFVKFTGLNTVSAAVSGRTSTTTAIRVDEKFFLHDARCSVQARRATVQTLEKQGRSVLPIASDARLMVTLYRRRLQTQARPYGLALLSSIASVASTDAHTSTPPSPSVRHGGPSSRPRLAWAKKPSSASRFIVSKTCFSSSILSLCPRLSFVRLPSCCHSFPPSHSFSLLLSLSCLLMASCGLLHSISQTTLTSRRSRPCSSMARLSPVRSRDRAS